jgi:hypothetical protein
MIIIQTNAAEVGDEDDDERYRLVRANRSLAEASVTMRKQANLKKTRLFIA